MPSCSAARTVPPVPEDRNFRLLERGERPLALEALSAAVKRLVESTVSTGHQAEELRALAAEVDALADRVGSERDADPWAERFYGEGITDAASMMALNPAIGRANPVAPAFESTINEDGSVSGTVRFDLQHVGPPYRAHGGIIAAVFDQALGIAAIAGKASGYTGEMTVRYKRATPLREALRFEARVVEASGRVGKATGELYDSEGTVTATAEATFVSARGEQYK
jgi:acyl-coenzyme A thioesterase PaaI-like protein